MIYVDSRVGSKELLSLFKRPAELGRLEYGDVCFVGKRDNMPVMVGVERKTVADFLNGLLNGRTVGHQLRGLLNNYNIVYIVVEGLWRSSKEGTLEVVRRRGWEPLRFGDRLFSASLLYNHLNTLEMLGGVYVRTTRGRQDTVDLIEALEAWWSVGPEAHTSHLAIDTVQPAQRTPDHKLRMRRPDTTVRIAAQLPHVGQQRCWDVAAHFGSVRAMANASVAEWKSLPRIGPKSAKDIVQALQTERRTYG